MSYEEALEELNKIVSQLEDGDLDLEESINLYEKGQALAAHCTELLKKAEIKIIELNEQAKEED